MFFAYNQDLQDIESCLSINFLKEYYIKPVVHYEMKKTRVVY
ncbi:hypothetical protein AB406_0191 [Riemerella anatipestifer]|uniref:Uncharacterized protein n=1 Tax=Riemerella anatipestifer TaxID=34085 RepID=A0A1S7DPX5_RIEAN|nr:hypothetical protein AB406_0191 [Riemerella anatipestifer]